MFVATDCPENCRECTRENGKTFCTSSGCESGYARNSADGTCHSKFHSRLFFTKTSINPVIRGETGLCLVSQYLEAIIGVPSLYFPFTLPLTETQNNKYTESVSMSGSANTSQRRHVSFIVTNVFCARTFRMPGPVLRLHVHQRPHRVHVQWL